MIIIPIIGVQPLPARGADDHHRPGVAGTKMQVTLAKIELAMDALVAVDRLLVLNQALANVLYDGMDPPPPGFVRVSIICRACWREDVLDMQRGIMTLERLRRSWRRCAECQSGNIEIAAA